MPEVLDRDTIKAISTDTRQDIMKMLAKRPYTASEISKLSGKHVTTVTEHLVVLEKSGLIRKRESTNKWVYYELTDKGEHLFKPQFYSWVIVFSLSVVFMFVGILRMFEGSFYSASAGASSISKRIATDLNTQATADIMPKTASPLAQGAAAAATPIDFVAHVLLSCI